MKIIQKLNTLSTFDAVLIRLLPEVFLALLFAYLSLRFLSFQKLGSHLGELHKESPKGDSLDHTRLANIHEAIHLSAKNMPFEAACYVQALAAKRMLNKRKIASTLYLGVRKNKKGITKGHAWLRSGSFIVTGAKGHQAYQVIASYS